VLYTAPRKRPSIFRTALEIDKSPIAPTRLVLKFSMSKSMSTQKGFTLIELLIVLAMAISLLAFAVPSLIKARQNAEQSSAIQSLRTIATAEWLYNGKHQRYGSLQDLGNDQIVDSVVASGIKSNYALKLTPSPDGTIWSCTAAPLTAGDLNYYYVDQTGVIRSNKGSPASSTSPPIPQ
jgi:type IV pilus assembly protein PilA